MITSGILSPLIYCRPAKTIRDVPSEKLVLWAMRLYSVCNLAWDYIDTIRDICILHRIEGTKKNCRIISQLKCEYDRFRQYNFNDAGYEAETENGLTFEEMFSKDFTRFNTALNEAASCFGSSCTERDLFLATQSALMLIDVVKIYARWCDRKIRSYGVWASDCVMVQNEFLKACPLVNEFLRPRWPIFDRKPYATALYCRLHIFGKIYSQPQ